MPFVILPTNSASGGYNITNSLRFNAGSNDFLSRTTGTPTNNKILTFSTWIKRSTLSTYMDLFDQDGGSSYGQLQLTNGDAFVIYQRTSGSTDFHLQTTQLFRDVSAWYHLVVAYDTSQATAANRIKLYVNGTQVTSFSIETYPSQNLAIRQNSSSLGITIANYSSGSNQYAGYMSEIYMIDGQQLTPSSFGETDEDTGIWKPKAYTGTYGTNGFYLQFKNSASLGTDSSGNGNNFTVNNLTSIDQTTDTPTNNFATMNPLMNLAGSGSGTLTEGNLQASYSGGAFGTCATICPSAGKWYWEIKSVSGTRQGTIGTRIGFMNVSSMRDNYYYVETAVFSMFAHPTDGIYRVVNGSWTLVSSSLTYVDGDIIGIALDLTNNISYWYKNGTLTVTSDFSSYQTIGTINFSATTGNGSGSASPVLQLNFGSPMYSGGSNTDGAGYGNFSYAVPSGYYALNTKNLANFG